MKQNMSTILERARKRLTELSPSTSLKPGVAETRSLWDYRFQSFMSDAFPERVETVPTAEDVLMFFATMYDFMEKRDDEKISYRSLMDGLSLEGLLTTEEKQQRQWIKAGLVKMMAEKMIEHALENGTTS
ncbi:hypothetical protein CGCA056_v000948 [Colletotrichum aenigma]|uniref:uncharacterized protein n=1 Tax=Colletotrichum aenigma TaxID=1215731 RepID=UPI0018724373|nr:uncharacterized protein CGCA056_v000948 [Colletotrichum aenigma]KAF5527117.1 hypothetical protein CGCA056_v000948 [Colletotrichum aenigma]